MEMRGCDYWKSDSPSVEKNEPLRPPKKEAGWIALRGTFFTLRLWVSRRRSRDGSNGACPTGGL
jgi:hypothetical protein